MGVRTFYLPLTSISALLLIVFSGILSAQPVLVLVGEPNTDDFPLVSSLFYAVDQDSNAVVDLEVDQVVVSENGIGRTVVSVTCPLIKPPIPISSVLALDVSGSMLGRIEGTAYTRLELVQEGARTWVEELDLSQSECAITSFHKRSSLELGFSSNRSQLISAIDNIWPAGGTNYDQAFIGDPAGGLTIAAKGHLKRVLVLLTDGKSEGNEALIIERAQAANVQVYCIAVGLRAPAILRNVAESTGGLWFESVSSIAQIQSIYRLILQHAQEIGACEMTWLSAKECERKRGVFVNIPDISAFTTTQYYAPRIDASQIWTDQPYLVFEGISLGETGILPLRIAASDTLTIDEMVFDGPEYTVVEIEDDPNFLPTTVLPGDTLEVAIRYSPLLALNVSRELVIRSVAGCTDVSVLCSGNFDPLAPRSSVRLTHPNGGEEFLVGVDTVIRWDGILPTDPVRLEYSIDEGRTWMEIVSRTTGLKYPWNVPNTPSQDCLARVTQLNPDRLFAEFPHPRRVVDARFTANGRSAVTVDEIGTVRVWNAITGALVQEVVGRGSASQLEVSSDGRFVAVAYGFGQILDIYDMQNAGRSASIYSAIPNSGKGVLAFTPDNASVVVGKFPVGRTTPTNAIVFHNPETGAIEQELATEYIPLSIAFSKNQSAPLLAIGSVDGYVEILNTDYTQRWLLRGSSSNDIQRVAFNSDGSRLIAVATSQTGGSSIAFWNTLTGGLLAFLPYDDVVRDIDLVSAQSGPRMLMVQSDFVPVVRNMPSGKLEFELTGHSGPVNSVRFNDTGDKVLTASDDFTARIWSTDSDSGHSDVSNSLWAIVVPEMKSYDVDFGSVPTGTISDSTLTAYVENRSTVAVDVVDIAIAGRDRGDFRIVSGAAPFTLQAGDKWDVEIEFYPQREGTFEATVMIETKAGVLQQRLYGTSTNPALKIVGLLGDFIDFGPVPLGQSRDSLAWAVNISNSVVDVRELLSTGPDDVQFEVRGSNPAVPVLLDPDDSIAIFVRFTPQRLGLTQGGVDLVYEGNGSPAMVGLFGEGISTSDPAIDAPSVLSYTVQQCYREPDTLTVEIRNPGSARLEVSNAEIIGTHPTDFRFVAPFVPFGVEPNEIQRVAIIFDPIGSGQRSAIMRLHSNASNAPQRDVALRGAVEQVELVVSETSVDVGRLCLTEEQDIRLVLTNTGNIATVVNLEGITDVNASGTIQASVNRVALADGNSSEVVIHIVAGDELGNGSGRIVFQDSTCGEQVEVLIQWEVGLPTLSIDSVPVVCVGDLVELSVRGAESYQWEYAEELSCLDCANPVVTAQNTQTYYVRGYDAWGCSVRDSVQVRVRNGSVELGVRIAREYRTRPGDPVSIIVELVDPVPNWGLVDNLELRIGYDPTVLVMHEERIEALLAGTLLAGWSVDEISDHVYGELVVRLSAPNGRFLTGPGTLLEIPSRPFFANVTGTELPLEVTTEGGCLNFAGEPGYIQVDSICGLHYRLFELGLAKYSLGEGMQNPVQDGVAVIPFSIGLDGETVVEVYDSRGTRTGIFLAEHLEAGSYHVLWDVGDVSPGLYYCRLTSGHWHQTKTLIIQQ